MEFSLYIYIQNKHTTLTLWSVSVTVVRKYAKQAYNSYSVICNCSITTKRNISKTRTQPLPCSLSV